MKIVGVCAILNGSDYDTAIALMAWKIMGSVDWTAVTVEPVVKLLSSSMRPVSSPSLLLKVDFD